MEFPNPDIRQQKEDLIDSIKELVGQEPVGLRVLLRTLSHPGVVTEVARYFAGLDTTNRCTTYEAPWNCSKEAEARYENIKYGWLGGAGGVGFDESWCPNCRKKVMGDEV